MQHTRHGRPGSKVLACVQDSLPALELQHMAVLGEITHITTYRYAKPVTFGTHRAMFLPRRGASARLLGWSAKTSVPSKVHWVTDSRSNAVTVMDFSEPGRELT